MANEVYSENVVNECKSPVTLLLYNNRGISVLAFEFS